MKSLVLSTMSADQILILNLTTISASPRTVTFNQSVWNFLVRGNEVILLIGPCHLPRESNLAWNNQLFVRIIYLFCLLPLKIFHFVSVFRTLFHLLSRDACLINELLNKANKIFKIYSVELNYQFLIVQIHRTHNTQSEPSGKLCTLSDCDVSV